MDFLTTKTPGAIATVLLAHGAGAPMDNEFMNAFCQALSRHKLKPVRFEFSYMASRRQGRRKPPPKAERLKEEFLEAVYRLKSKLPLIIGGKSMGGRVASMVADELFDARMAAGLVCLGYPFHPPGKPADLRTAHLRQLAMPALICQGSRDPFGDRNEVKKFALSASISLFWFEDGDHDFRPRKASGYSHQDHITSAARALAEWWHGQA